MNKIVKSDLLVIAKQDKAKREAKLVIANIEKAKREAKLVIEKIEKAKRTAELVIAKEEKAKRVDELIIAKGEKAKRAAELIIANEEKADRAAELVIANAEKAKRHAKFVIANAEKAKRHAGLIIASAEKAKRANELIIDNKEHTFENEDKVKSAAELVIANVKKTKHAAELVIANVEIAKRAAKLIIANKELSFQTREKAKRASELIIAEAEKAKHEATLVIANIKKAKLASELVIANVEKAKRAAELVIANKGVVYQNAEKAKRAAEFVIANVEKAKRAAKLVIANVEKAKRAAEIVIANKDLTLVKEKAKHTAELIFLNKELTLQIDKRKQSSQKLKESNKKYSEAFKSSPYAITITSIKDGKFIELNDTFISILGFTREEAMTNSAVRLDMWADIEERKSVMTTLLDGGDVVGKECLFKKKNGEIITGLFSAKIIHVKNVPCILSSINDITKRKNAEKTLLEIIDNNPMSIQITDTQGLTLKVNHAFMLLFGSIPTSDSLLFNDVQLNEKGFGKLIEHIKNGEVVHFPDMQFNPHYSVPEMPDIPVWVRTIVFPLVDSKGKPEKFVFVHENITERKLAEESLVKNNLKYKELTESISDVFFALDKNLIYTYWNKACEKLTGIPAGDALGKSLNEIFPDNKARKQIEEICIQVMESKKPQYLTITYPNDNSIFLEISAYWNIEGVSMFIKDISENKQAELLIKEKNLELTLTNTELIRAKEKAEESDRLKSAFLTNMSHEIRTPMNGIMGFTELLKDPNLSSNDQQDFIQAIQISGARMLNTINSIVDISKIESGLIGVDIKETNLNETIEYTYKFFKPEVENKGLQFKFKNSLTAKEALIKTDNEKVYGILTNLVRNAIKFTYEGSIEFGYEKKGEYLEFFVKDTGIGIPEIQHELIFERFRQGSESHNRGYQGSGLGLSICKSYVDMLGGRIWVESEESNGSTFFFTIPYNPVLEETHTIENVVFSENKEVQIRKLKILIVDDDEISYSLLTRTMQKISKEVLHAITGVQAIEACRNNPDIDLVLMDIRMPKMDGNEATRQIRQFNKDVIIIAQTAYAFTGDSEKAIEAGCNDYISKPINKILLHELIKKHCN